MTNGKLIQERLTHSVIGAFYEAYDTLGFGFLEHLSVLALERELRTRGHEVGREIPVPILYNGRELGWQRLDMIVDSTLVVETKATTYLDRSALRQLYNYLRASELEVGLVLHFGPRPKFHRVVCTNVRGEGLLRRPRDPLRPPRPRAPSPVDVSSSEKRSYGAHTRREGDG